MIANDALTQFWYAKFRPYYLGEINQEQVSQGIQSFYTNLSPAQQAWVDKNVAGPSGGLLAAIAQAKAKQQTGSVVDWLSQNTWVWWLVGGWVLWKVLK